MTRLPRLSALLFLLALLLPLAAPPAGADEGAAPAAEVDPAEQARVEEIVAELRALTAEIRGLEWKQTVPVEVLTRAQTRKKMLASIKEDLPPEELEAANRILKRLKMLGPDDDLLAIVVDMVSGSAGGFFDPKEKKFYVVAGQSPESQKPVIVHELVHALEDQYVDLEEHQERFEKDPDRMFAFKCLIEGSAEIARVLYEERFPEEAKRFHEGMRGNAELQQGQMRAMAKTPAFLILPMQLHYRAGPSFVTQALDGRPYAATIDALYDEDAQPVSQEQVLHPRKFLGEERDYPQVVSWGGDFAELAGEAWTELDELTNGELDLALWLDFHLSADGGKLTMIDAARGTFVVEEAWRAAVGWDAGRHVFLDRDGASLAFVSAYAFDTEADAQEAFAAVWKVLKRTHGDGYTEHGHVRDDAGATESVDYACPVGRSRLLRRGREVLIADGLPEDAFERVWPAVEATTFVRDARDTWDPATAADPFAGYEVVNRRRGIAVDLPNEAWSEDAQQNRMGASNPTYVTTVGAGEISMRISAVDQGASGVMLPAMIKMFLGPLGASIEEDQLKPARVMGQDGLYLDLAPPGSSGVRRLYAGSDGQRTLIVMLRGPAEAVAARQAEVEALISGVRSILSY